LTTCGRAGDPDPFLAPDQMEVLVDQQLDRLVTLVKSLDFAARDQIISPYGVIFHVHFTCPGKDSR